MVCVHAPSWAAEHVVEEGNTKGVEDVRGVVADGRGAGEGEWNCRRADFVEIDDCSWTRVLMRSKHC